MLHYRDIILPRIVIGSYSIMVSILALIKSPLNQCLIALYLLENEIILQCKGSWMQLKEIVLLDLHQTFISLTAACICFCQLIVMIHFLRLLGCYFLLFLPTVTCLAGAISICYPPIWCRIISQQYCFPLSDCMSSVSCRSLPSLES